MPTFYLNAPARLPKVNNVGDFQVAFQDIIRNCEDAYLNQNGGWALLSCDPGRDEWNAVMGIFVNSAAPPETDVYLYRYSEGDGAKPVPLKWEPAMENRDDWHPLGIEYHEQTETLYVIHTLPRPRVDWYKLDVEAGVAKLTGSAGHEARITTPNSVAAINETAFFVTNDHLFDAQTSPILSKLETYAGFPGGSVVYVRHGQDGKKHVAKALASVPFANGVALLNASTLAVASLTTASVRLFEISNDPADDMPQLTPVSIIAVPFLPDNLSVDSQGKLLIAGHPHAPSTEEVGKGNAACHGHGITKAEACQLPKLSWVAEWSEEEGVKTLYSGSEFGTSTTAVRDPERGIGFVVGLYESGLMSWSFPSSSNA